MTSYRKTKQGEWVVFGPADAVHVGQVQVAKKSGETKVETVTRVGKAFQVDGRSMVYGYLAPAAPQPVRRNRPSVERCYYGHTAPVRNCTDCFDTFDW